MNVVKSIVFDFKIFRKFLQWIFTQNAVKKLDSNIFKFCGRDGVDCFAKAFIKTAKKLASPNQFHAFCITLFGPHVCI